MGKHKDEQIIAMDMEGRFLGFTAQDGYKLKYLQLATASGEQTIKIPKDLRSILYRTLIPGEWIQVHGYQKISDKKGKSTFKAEDIRLKAPSPTVEAPSCALSQPSVPKVKPQAILVCQKSDCCKRGGRALLQALQHELHDRGMDDRLTVKATGCMKQCKAGPNLVMPDKTRYSRIHAEEVGSLLERHFPAPAPASNS